MESVWVDGWMDEVRKEGRTSRDKGCGCLVEGVVVVTYLALGPELQVAMTVWMEGRLRNLLVEADQWLG